MAIKYNSSSLYYSTKIVNDQYLDILSIRSVPAESDDYLYTVEEKYTHRPDLLAFDLYNNEKLWWVFSQRNMNLLKDPIFDMVAGLEIYLPKGRNLRKFLGI